MDEDFEIDYWYPDDAHEGFQQWDEAGSEDLEDDSPNTHNWKEMM